MGLSVKMTGCIGLSDSSRQQAEGAFLDALLHAVGGPEEAGPAYTAYQATLARHGGNLPMDADGQDREIVQRWEDAYSAGINHAFIGWVSRPEGFSFTVVDH